MIACACKEIYMGKHSSLGPIDPQLNGMPAHGVIEDFNRAHEEMKKDQSKILVWHPILANYPPAFRDQCEKAIELTKEMVTKWLCIGMFNDLDEEEAKCISGEIVDKLRNYDQLKSHNRHLPPTLCKEMGLKIQYLEDNPELQDAVLSAHHACIHTLGATPAVKIIENHDGKASIQQVNQIVVNQQRANPQQTNPQLPNPRPTNKQSRKQRSRKR